MDELAAMAAYPPSELAYTGTSGLLIATESNASTLINDLSSEAGDKGTCFIHHPVYLFHYIIPPLLLTLVVKQKISRNLILIYFLKFGEKYKNPMLN